MDLKQKYFTISLIIATILQFSYGCDIVDHFWIVPIQTEILDVHEGIVLTRNTTDITGINNAIYGEATAAGPYFDISIEDSQLIVRTNEAFRRYEEVEVAQRVSITIEVNCAGGTTRGGLFLWIDLIDTNNNAPEFLPTSEYEFVIMPPLPPGYLITGCYNDPIIAKDIDLTTQRIDFTIEDNPYFEIEYDEATSTVAKQFNAQLRTKTLLRSLSEPLILQITATDVDLSPPSNASLSTTAVVRIVPDTQFQFPEELVFGQTFYLANYTDDHQINLLETISLRQGYDTYVNFTMEGDYADNFDLIKGDNIVSLVVKIPLPDYVISQGQTLLVVKAHREFTSGASATVIVQFSQEIDLQFEKAIYEGLIVNNSLQIQPLILSQGDEEATISAEVIGEYWAYFSASVQGLVVTLTMDPLPADAIDKNSFITLQIVARAGVRLASTVVNLDIIKEDNVTPVFNQSIYSGSYDPVTGLSVEQIVFAQGFDDTVSIELVGEHSNLFRLVENGPILTLSSSPIPAEIFSEHNILLSIEASKPLTVGANAAIYIALPAARELVFEDSTYRGRIEEGVLSLQTILLSQGYENGVGFNISGEFASYFTTTNVQGQVTVALPDPLPDAVITQNNVILLTLTASGINAVTTSTNILLDIIKYDTITPMFTRSIYNGTYYGAAIEIEAINLSQGFDDNVTFRLDGGHAEYFSVERVGEDAVITLQSPIPEDVILSEKVLVFNVFADKALTVGANAAVLIRFPSELTDLVIMEFSKNTYVGTLEENEIRLENITLESGFAPGTEFILSGDFANHFYISNTASENIIQLSSNNTLASDVLNNNTLIVFEVEARRPRAVSVWTSLILYIVKQEVIAPVFSQAFYTGAYTEETGLTFGQVINLSEGFDETVTFALSEEVNDWFALEQDGESLYLVSKSPVPSEVLASNGYFLFTIVASNPSGVSGSAAIFIDLQSDVSDSLFRFQQSFYKGFLENNGSITVDEIVLEKYTNEVNYTIIGDHAENFQVTNQNGTFTIQLETPISDEILEETSVFVITLEAQSLHKSARTIIVLEKLRIVYGTQQLEFEQPYYLGTYLSATGLQFNAEIRLINEVMNATFDLEGEDAEWFGLVRSDSSVTVTLRSVIPAAVTASNQQLIFVITAQSDNSNTARATVVISLNNSISETPLILGFDHITYMGSIENNQTNIPTITLIQGESQDVEYVLHGELSDYFRLIPDGPNVTVLLRDGISQDVVPANNIIVLELQATAPDAVTAFATIVLHIIRVNSVDPVLELTFYQTFYNGSYAEATGLNFPTPISLAQGYDYDSNVVFDVEGDDAQYFNLVRNNSSVTVTLRSAIPTAVTANNQQLVFVVTAQSDNSNTARAVVIISLIDYEQPGLNVTFDKVLYEGTLEDGVVNHETITLVGFSGPAVELRGEYSLQFSSSLSNGEVTVTSASLSIPDDVTHIAFEIHAGSASAVLLIRVSHSDEQPVLNVTFDKVLYEGTLEDGVVNHETITLVGFSGPAVELQGEYSLQFSSSLSNGEVTVTSASLSIPNDVTHIALEIHAGSASAVLLIRVSHSDEPSSPTVAFQSTSYAFQVDTYHTGLVGTVQATSSNGEAVTYSLELDNDVLQDKLSVNNEGEIHLSGTVVSGLFTFEVIATGVSSLIKATATVHLSVESSPVCGDEHVMAPLIVLDVDEEQPHYDLMSAIQYDNCHFTLTNRWPVDHTWLYVDERGLHATAIDREHESIAFMALSQVQVEVILRCDGDSTRIKRSLTSDALGPYDYGSNKWVLTDTISFNARRSYVNIIVNDINDNAPIFVGKENEPIVVGYPVPELAERVLPRSLAELQATDADIGENAALLYWSSAPELAVAPSTGFVHLRDGASLANRSRYTVNATDMNGQGLTGSIDILVLLLDESYIAVVTVRDAYLDDEQTIVSNLSYAIGYELKVLRSVVISGEAETSRKKRDITSTGGASLQMYVYGLMASEPVPVERLTNDISNIVTAPVIIASSVSLQDHLEGQEICVIAGRDTGLLVATIVLSVLLFILLALIAVWFFLRWRKNRNYDEFSDENSLASRKLSEDGVSKPDVMPRLDIAELKKSERRLQEMLDTPVEEVYVEPTSSKNDEILNLPEPTSSIVTFDKLKDADDISDDEFGEIKTPRRKSVVTFNENVEKIIHLEDTPDAEDQNSEPEFEVYKL